MSEQPKTVRVRIAVVVTSEPGDDKRRWVASGWDGCLSDDYAANEARDCLDAKSFGVVFVEADVPLPAAPVVVQGEVT